MSEGTSMATAPWARLGKLLIQRRAQLDPRYMNRRLFADDRGLDYRLVADIERARRQNFEESTLAAIEVAYAWAPDSILRVLADGDPMPLPDEPAVPAAAPEPEPEAAAGNAEDIGDAVVTVLRARQGEPGVWADLRDYLAGAGLFNDAAEAGAWPPGDIPAKLTPKAEQALDAAAVAGTLFRDEIGTIAARIGSHARDGSYPWHLRVRMITQLRETARETARNPTRARRAG